MPSTPSDNVRLELMDTGEQSDQWGDVTNTNWEMIEGVLSGILSKTIVNSDTPTEITVTDFNLGEYHNAVVLLTGTLTANRVLELPALERIWFVINQTSGGFDVTVRSPSETGVSVANGESAILYNNGTDVSKLLSGSVLPSGSTIGQLEIGLTAARTINSTTDDNSVLLSGGTTGSLGGNVQLFGQNHATLASTGRLRSGTTVLATWNASGLTIAGDTNFTGAATVSGTPVVLESRTLTGGTGIQSIGDLSANRTIQVSAELQRQNAISGSGFAVRNGTTGWLTRTITGSSNISVSNGNGVSGNPSISLSANPSVTTITTSGAATVGGNLSVAGNTFLAANLLVDNPDNTGGNDVNHILLRRGDGSGNNGRIRTRCGATNTVRTVIIDTAGGGEGIEIDTVDGLTDLNGIPYARVSQSTSTNETSFPIGTYLWVTRGGGQNGVANRKATGPAVFCLSTNNNADYVFGGGGSNIAGTWRGHGRGQTDNGGSLSDRSAGTLMVRQA